jgi:hypothetical protein
MPALHFRFPRHALNLQRTCQEAITHHFLQKLEFPDERSARRLLTAATGVATDVTSAIDIADGCRKLDGGMRSGNGV